MSTARGTKVRFRRSILAALATLPLLASCAADGPDGSGGPTASEGTGGSGSSAAGSPPAPTDLPRGDGDPCDPNPSPGHQVYECRTVGWVDLDDDGTADPIGMTLTGSPALFISAHVGGKRYERMLDGPAFGPASGTGQLSLEATLHTAFYGAYDFAGDGTPLITVWSDQGDEFNSFRVFHYTGAELVHVSPPGEGFSGRTYDWVHKLDAGHPSHRCTGDPGSALDVIRPLRQEGMLSVYPHKLSQGKLNSAFISAGEESRTPITRVPTNELGIDCEDMAQHAEP